jgi:hypothetical protein
MVECNAVEWSRSSVPESGCFHLKPVPQFPEALWRKESFGAGAEFMSRAGLYKRLTECGHQAGDGNRPAIIWPWLAVHFDQKLAIFGKTNSRKLDFEILVSVIILDRNSQICFHKTMLTKAKAKTIVHSIVQSWLYINS